MFRDELVDGWLSRMSDGLNHSDLVGTKFIAFLSTSERLLNTCPATVLLLYSLRYPPAKRSAPP